MSATPREPRLELELAGEPGLTLFAERLRDGRLAFGTRRAAADAGARAGSAGEMHLLERREFLELASWLAVAVEDEWIGTVRERREEPLRTARDLYGDAADGAQRLARDLLGEIPPALMLRALLLLLNAIGPDARRRLIERLNRTSEPSEDAALRRRVDEEQAAFAYAVAAAALFDALEQGLAGPAAKLP